MSKRNLKTTYSRFVDLLKLTPAITDPMKTAVGGQFDAFGVVEREMLRFFGLRPDQFLVDVGCGSGRLAIPLSRDHEGGYLGTDVVPELLAYARERCNRPDWRFEAVDTFKIPAKDGTADMVCFFSVVTHLLHEHSYLYFEEAKRVLKPGGRIVFSFLEYANPEHHVVFDLTLSDSTHLDLHPLNVFMDRDGIRYWARRLGLDIVEIRDGTDLFVPLPEPVALDDGSLLEGHARLGQSICVLEKPKA